MHLASRLEATTRLVLVQGPTQGSTRKPELGLGMWQALDFEHLISSTFSQDRALLSRHHLNFHRVCGFLHHGLSLGPHAFLLQQAELGHHD